MSELNFNNNLYICGSSNDIPAAFADAGNALVAVSAGNVLTSSTAGPFHGFPDLIDAGCVQDECFIQSVASAFCDSVGLRRRLFCSAQESRADRGIEQIGDQRPEADVRQEMICHMDAVIAVQQNERTGKAKCDPVFLFAAVPAYVRQHRQRKHHACDRHIPAGPAFEIIVAARQVWDHLPPVPVFRHGIIKCDQILISWS